MTGMARSGRLPTFVGPLPPPLHGFSTINASVVKALKERGRLVILDQAPSQLKSLVFQYAGFLVQVLSGRCSCLYLALSGGRRQILDGLFCAIAAVFGVRTVVHHHSFAYLNRSSLLARAVFRAAGRSARHVVLCGCMSDRLGHLYGIDPSRILVVSNAAFVDPPAAEARDPGDGPLVLGYLSAVSQEKGALAFLDLASACLEQGLTVRAVVAGPLDPKFEAEFRRALSMATGVDYRGAVYGPAKADFFQEIDVLVFPSRYANEAEPVTILEAASFGVPVLALARGCIDEMASALGGAVVADEGDFVGKGRRMLREMAAGSRLAEDRDAIRRRFAKFREVALTSRGRMLDLITDGSDG